MKKIILFILAMLFISLNISAQNRHIVVGKNYVNPNEITLVAERGVSTTIKFDLNELDLMEIETNYGISNKISSAKATIMLDEGNPELFYLPTAIIIPDLGSAQLEITTGEYTEYTDIDIVPSKGSILRTVDPSTIPYTKGEVYNHDAFFPGTLAQINETFIMRDVRGLSLFVYPVQYNPVTKTLRIYSEITVTVNYTETKGENEFTTQKRHETIDPTFAQMYENLFLNYNNLSRGFPTGEEGELLIICAPAFLADMQPYVDWKRTIGRKTTLVSTAVAGTTASAIQTYIKNQYQASGNNIAFVLLVGDKTSCPPIGTSNPRSDIKYGQINSGNYLDVLVGRFSATTSTHVQTQVQKAIWYERDTKTSDTWISSAAGIAAFEGGPSGNYHGSQPGGHDGYEADYTHMNNIRTRLLNYGYNPVYQEYTWNAPGVENTTLSQISSRFNSGVSMANYCNHGSPDAWTISTSSTGYLNYNNAQVNALTNAKKLPFIFSVACNNGEFGNWQYNTSGSVCFAETWLRANNAGQLTGAIAFLGATISISWEPPMTAQDVFANIIIDVAAPYSGTQPGTKRTMAGAMLNATQKMLMVHGTGCLGDYNSWTVFGDPTLMFRTKTPQEMNVTHLPNLSPGTSSFSVTCDVEGAKATISYKNASNEVIILGTAVVTGGTANITFTEPTTNQTEFTLSVTGFNKVTYLKTLEAGPLVLNAPEKLTAEVEKANHVILTWDAPKGKGLTLKGYNVYRNDGLITMEPISDVTAFTDIAPANGEYKYAVTAFYGATLESEPSNSVTVLIDGMCIPFDSKKITAVQSFEIEGVNVLISWSAPEYEGTELAGYNVYRDGEPINSEIIPATELSFLDTELKPETEYCYQVEVKYNDCEDTFKSAEKCLTTLSINEISGMQSFCIFPNPANGNLTIKGAGLNRVEIYDVQGRKLAEYNNVKDNLQINAGKYENGVYFVKMYSENQQIVTKRLVIVK